MSARVNGALMRRWLAMNSDRYRNVDMWVMHIVGVGGVANPGVWQRERACPPLDPSCLRPVDWHGCFDRLSNRKVFAHFTNAGASSTAFAAITRCMNSAESFGMRRWVA